MELSSAVPGLPESTSELKKTASTLDNFEVVRTLGSGYSGKVKLVLDYRTGVFAAKIFKSPSLELKSRFEEMISNEVNNLRKVEHPNVLKIISVHPNGKYVRKGTLESYTCFYVLMEFCPNGSLFDLIAQNGALSESEARYYFHQLISAIETCHSHGFAHRDLKLENMLLDSEFNLKLADFGFSFNLEGRDGSGFMRTNLGTNQYKAPEIHLNQPYSGVAVDIFSAGIILFIMQRYNPPFYQAARSDLLFKYLSEQPGKFWQIHESQSKLESSSSLKDIVTKMMAFDPSMRLSIYGIKVHEWFNGQVTIPKQVGSAIIEQKRTQKEKARECRRKGVKGPRLYRGISQEDSLSLSLTSENSYISPTKVREPFDSIRVFGDFWTGLEIEHLWTLVTTALSNLNAEYGTVSQDEIIITYVGLNEHADFKIKLKSTEEMNLLQFKLKQGNSFEYREVVKAILGAVQEASGS